MMAQLDPQHQLTEGNIGGFGGADIHLGAGIGDILPAKAYLHGIILVGQAAEAGRVVIDEEAV